MNTKSIILLSAAISGLALTSCSGMKSINSVPPSAMGVVGKSYDATVISARMVEVQASNTSKNIGTLAGALAGGAAGSMLGKGSGNDLAIAGGAIAGGLLARNVTAAAATTPGQQLKVKVTGSSATYTITQPVYEEYGVIQPGTQGQLIESGNNSYFEPY